MKIAFEGNIGCGKTTVLNTLFKEKRFPIVLEPVDDWKEWLTLYYSDVNRWGTMFNINVLHHFHDWSLSLTGKNKILFERSPVSNKYVFSELHKELHGCTTIESELYDKSYKTLGWTPDVIVYIRTDPDVCLKRMTMRARECENLVDIEYITHIHNKYEAMMQREDMGSIIFTIDGNQDDATVFQDICKFLNTF